GLPHFLVGDESSILGGALKMAELKNPIPGTNSEAFRILYYPPFLPWALLIILAPFVGITSLGMPLTEIREFFILHPETLLLIGRIFVALIGTASVYVLYRIVRRMFGEREGILAAILLALSFFHVSLSHFLRHWVPAALFILLAFYFAWQILEKKNPHAYLWGALTVGLGSRRKILTPISGVHSPLGLALG
ncbi:glycosyltransferase family 39 protein, partial [Candidatus Azambacteria bacterium]|nr:glycosyltransferase family 39 protein [Candidatus Azambacteria bacterium]